LRPSPDVPLEIRLLLQFSQMHEFELVPVDNRRPSGLTVAPAEAVKPERY